MISINRNDKKYARQMLVFIFISFSLTHSLPVFVCGYFYLMSSQKSIFILTYWLECCCILFCCDAHIFSYLVEFEAQNWWLIHIYWECDCVWFIFEDFLFLKEKKKTKCSRPTTKCRSHGGKLHISYMHCNLSLSFNLSMYVNVCRSGLTTVWYLAESHLNDIII